VVTDAMLALLSQPSALIRDVRLLFIVHNKNGCASTNFYYSIKKLKKGGVQSS